VKNETAIIILSVICAFLATVATTTAFLYKNEYQSMDELEKRLNSLSGRQKSIEYYHENCGRWITDLEKRVDELER
jgi:hypothetical protein